MVNFKYLIQNSKFPNIQTFKHSNNKTIKNIEIRKNLTFEYKNLISFFKHPKCQSRLLKYRVNQNFKYKTSNSTSLIYFCTHTTIISNITIFQHLKLQYLKIQTFMPREIPNIQVYNQSDTPFFKHSNDQTAQIFSPSKVQIQKSIINTNFR